MEAKKLIIGNTYYLYSDSASQSWNNGECSLISFDGKKRALVFKLNTQTKFNVPISSLYSIIPFICIKEIREYKIGDIIDMPECWFGGIISDNFIPLAIHREQKINDIIND